MKQHALLPMLALALASCATSKKPAAEAAASGHVPLKNGVAAEAAAKQAATAATDDTDEYGGATEISDPLEPLNRATFVFNDKLYAWVFTPISKGYTLAVPKPVRGCIDNAYENVKFPVRFVNSGLQGNFSRAGKEAQKFGVNTIAGVGGLFKVSDKIASLVDVPAEDSGQTLAKWGIGHGPYFVIPVLGPSSARELVGQAGDYALNPVNWGFVFTGDADDWAWIPPTGNTIRSMPDQLSKYNDSKADAIDPYTAVRSSFVQNRKAASEQ